MCFNLNGVKKHQKDFSVEWKFMKMYMQLFSPEILIKFKIFICIKKWAFQTYSFVEINIYISYMNTPVANIS